MEDTAAHPLSAESPTATVRITRVPGGRRDRLRAYSILLDSEVAATIRSGESVALALAPGRHSVQMAIDWARSRPLAVDLGPGETAELRCAPNTSQWPLIGATFGRADYLRLWHAGGPDDDGPVEERYPFPWLRLLLLGLALAALGVSIARGRVWDAVLLGIVALVPAAVLGAWFYARTRMRSGGSERGP